MILQSIAVMPPGVTGLAGSAVPLGIVTFDMLLNIEGL
jgi:hypothetical protein